MAVVATELCFTRIHPDSLAVIDAVELFVPVAVALPGGWSSDGGGSSGNGIGAAAAIVAPSQRARRSVMRVHDGAVGGGADGHAGGQRACRAA